MAIQEKQELTDFGEKGRMLVGSGHYITSPWNNSLGKEHNKQLYP